MTTKTKEQRIINLERKYAINDLYNHKVRALIYKLLLAYFSKKYEGD